MSLTTTFEIIGSAVDDMIFSVGFEMVATGSVIDSSELETITCGSVTIVTDADVDDDIDCADVDVDVDANTDAGAGGDTDAVEDEDDNGDESGAEGATQSSGM